MSSDTVRACPECDASGKVRRLINDEHDRRYHCDECGERFDDYKEREPYCESGGVRGLAARLDEMEADELGS